MRKSREGEEEISLISPYVKFSVLYYLYRV